MLADARPQVRKKTGGVAITPAYPSAPRRALSRGNTLSMFLGENDADVCRSFAAVEWHYLDRRLKAVRQACFALVDGWFNS